MRTKYLLYCGTATSLTFWFSTIISGYLHQNYNHIRDTVSELGALGTKSHSFMIAATWLSAAFGLLFAVGIIRTCWQLHVNIIPALTTISIPFSFAWVAIFPAGRERHAQGGVAMFLLYLGMLLAILLWRGKDFGSIRICSMVSLVLMLLLILRFTPFAEGHDGLVQRFAHLGWSVWLISLNFFYLKKLRFKSKVHNGDLH